MAFVLIPAPFIGTTGKRARCPVLLRRQTRVLQSPPQPAWFACASPPSEDEVSNMNMSQNTEKKKTKAEEITEMLGRDVEEERKKGQTVVEDSEEEMRTNYILAGLSIIVALVIFADEKLNPVSPMSLIHKLEERSQPVEVIGKGKPTVVDFYAPWCENCRAMAKDMFELEGRYVGAVNFITINTEEQENEAFADAYDVQGLPQVTFIDKDGKVITNLIGKTPRVVLDRDIDALVRGSPLPYTPDGNSDEQIALFPEENRILKNFEL